MKFIDFIVVVGFFLIAIWFLVKGAPGTFGAAGLF